MDETASFDELISWGHEVMPNQTTDPFVKGLEEWVGFAERVCARFSKCDDL